MFNVLANLSIKKPVCDFQSTALRENVTLNVCLISATSSALGNK